MGYSRSVNIRGVNLEPSDCAPVPVKQSVMPPDGVRREPGHARRRCEIRCECAERRRRCCCAEATQNRQHPGIIASRNPLHHTELILPRSTHSKAVGGTPVRGHCFVVLGRWRTTSVLCISAAQPCSSRTSPPTASGMRQHAARFKDASIPENKPENGESQLHLEAI